MTSHENDLLFPSQEIPLLNHTPSTLILECHPGIGESYSEPGFTKYKTSIEFPEPSLRPERIDNIMFNYLAVLSEYMNALDIKCESSKY